MVLRGNGPGCTRMRAYACTRGSLQLATSSGHLCSPTTEPQAPRLKPLVGQDGTCCCSPRGEPATCKDEASSFSHAVDGGSYHGSELSSILHFWASVSTARGARPRVGRACCDGLIERRIDALASTDICRRRRLQWRVTPWIVQRLSPSRQDAKRVRMLSVPSHTIELKLVSTSAASAFGTVTSIRATFAPALLAATLALSRLNKVGRRGSADLGAVRTSSIGTNHV